MRRSLEFISLKKLRETVKNKNFAKGDSVYEKKLINYLEDQEIQYDKFIDSLEKFMETPFARLSFTQLIRKNKIKKHYNLNKKYSYVIEFPDMLADCLDILEIILSQLRVCEDEAKDSFFRYINPEKYMKESEDDL